VLEAIDEPALLRGVRELGAMLAAGIAAIDGVREVRSRGLMIGVGLEQGIDAPELAAGLLRDGLIVNVPEPGTLRLLPPLVIGTEEAEIALGLLDGAISGR
jgi:acetylornithine/N-succinyldiaminopimelate aminotransferase